jgi:hypothetical protein
MSGILDRERSRRQFWDQRGLPDPLRVLAEERAARLYVPGFRSPRRAPLDEYFATHPNDRPRDW